MGVSVCLCLSEFCLSARLFACLTVFKAVSAKSLWMYMHKRTPTQMRSRSRPLQVLLLLLVDEPVVT